MAVTLLQRLLPFHAGMGEWPGKLSAEEIVMDANGWRPISEAPKDGTLLLGWWDKGMSGKGLPFILIWARWQGGGFSGEMCWMDFERCWPREPSHWMPLPQPPAQEVK